MSHDRHCPVYDLDGALVETNIVRACRVLDCSRPTLYACTVPWQDGRRLVRAPQPAGLRVGRHPKARPTLLPGEEQPRPTLSEAARAAGVSRWALRNRGRDDEGVLVVREARHA